MTEKDKILTRIETEWDDLMESIDGIDPKTAGQAGVSGDHSVKDLFAHIALWDKEAVNEARARLAGNPGRRIDFDALNAKSFSENADRAFDELHNQMVYAHRTMMEALGRMDRLEESWVENDTWLHYRDHAADIRAWRDRLGS